MSRRWARAAARAGLMLGGALWCCNLYEGRTFEFFPEGASESTECRDSAQCPRERAFCAGGVCRECLIDADCGPERPACVGNACVECRSASDCPPGRACNPVLSTCALVCDEPSDCAGQAASRCSGELDVCVQCLLDADCDPRNPACDSGGRCVECTADRHCRPDRPSCDVSSRRCVECLDSSQCGGRVCDPRELRCVECLDAADCGSGSCDVERRRCLEPCAGAADCDPRRPVCDAASSSCVQCTARADCTDPRRPACTPEHECVECLADADCAQPDRPACIQATRRCGQCTSDEHCSAGQRCELAAARCVPAPGEPPASTAPAVPAAPPRPGPPTDAGAAPLRP